MANIKITELNGITKKASDDVLAIVDVSADETKKIAVEDLLDKNVELIAVTDTEPAECSYGDKYFNTTDNLIYTAIATDTWSEDGEEPISGILYIVYSEQASYSWNGTELISVGGGKEDIVIDDEEPTDPDVKLWIDTGEVGSQASEITNEYSTSTGLGYSANYINELISQRETEVILDLNWVNQDKQITVEDGYLYIAFISWASSCVLFQYANGTNINRQISGSNSFTSNKVDNTYTIHIDNTGLMFGFKIKI